MKSKIADSIKSTLVITNRQSIDIAVEKIYDIIQNDIVKEIHTSVEDLFLGNDEESYKRLKKIIENN